MSSRRTSLVPQAWLMGGRSRTGQAGDSTVSGAFVTPLGDPPATRVTNAPQTRRPSPHRIGMQGIRRPAGQFVRGSSAKGANTRLTSRMVSRWPGETLPTLPHGERATLPDSRACVTHAWDAWYPALRRMAVCRLLQVRIEGVPDAASGVPGRWATLGRRGRMEPADTTRPTRNRCGAARGVAASKWRGAARGVAASMWRGRERGGGGRVRSGAVRRGRYGPARRQTATPAPPFGG